MRRVGRFIWLIITTLVVAIAIAFATSNETLITLYLWPFDGVLAAPIWLVVMSSFITGGLLSICLMWAQALSIRARLWNLQVKFNRLETEMTQQRMVTKKHSDDQTNRIINTNNAPTPQMKDQEAKTFLSEPLPTDQTLR